MPRPARALLTAAGVATGLAAEHLLLRRRRVHDSAAGEAFGRRRGVRQRWLELGDGTRLFVEEAGPVGRCGAVFVHGSALRTDVWHYQLSGIDGFRLVFYDLRGHGLSRPQGHASLSVETMSHDLERVIEDCGLHDVVVVGHSLGGMVALHLCASRIAGTGARVRGIVLLNTPHVHPLETIVGGAALARIERVLRRPFDMVGTQASGIDRLRRVVPPSDAAFWAVALAAFGPRASARQIDFVYSMLSSVPSDVIFDLFKAYRSFDVREALVGIDVPALVVAGSHDRFTVLSASRYLARHLPEARLEVIEDCGHLSMLERHEELNTMLRAFLAETLADAGTPRISLEREAEQ